MAAKDTQIGKMFSDPVLLATINKKGGQTEQVLQQQPKSETPGLGGTDNGQVQAFGLSDIPGVGDLEKKVGDKVVDVVTGSRTVTIIITNKSDKPLHIKEKKLSSGDWKSGQGPPLEIEAAKDGKPGVATMVVESNWGPVGRYIKDTDVDLVYEIVGDEKNGKVVMHLTRTSIRAKTKHSEKIDPDGGVYKVLGNAKDNDTFEFLVSGGDGQDAKGKDTSDVSCRITVHNESKYDLKLRQVKNEVGDFGTNPPDTLPAGKAGSFVYGQTPHAKDAKKQGAKGWLVYEVGAPSVTQWRCDWDNPMGEKNNGETKTEPQVAGLRPVAHWDQGDENVPYDFSLFSDDTGGGTFEFEIGPFKVGEAEKLESGSLDKVVYDILHNKLPKAVLDTFEQGDAGSIKMVLHGYASNTGSEKFNLALSSKRAEKVIEAFKKLGAPPSAFRNPIPHGEWETENPTDDKKQEKENPNWRKVVLKVFVK